MRVHNSEPHTSHTGAVDASKQGAQLRTYTVADY